MKTMNKVIVAMMMAITTAMPTVAGNKKHFHGKSDKIVVVVDKNKSHFGAHRNIYRPDMKTCTFRVRCHDSHMRIVARAERMHGVINTKWNPRTRELTVIYDAKVTSARHIMNSVA